jgi:hypothetical protein
LRECLDAVNIPQLLAPAWEDPSYLRPDGAYVKRLNEPGRPSQGSESHVFADQRHGWAVRGDVRDPAVKKAVDLVLAQVLAFFEKHIAGAGGVPGLARSKL